MHRIFGLTLAMALMVAMASTTANAQFSMSIGTPGGLVQIGSPYYGYGGYGYGGYGPYYGYSPYDGYSPYTAPGFGGYYGTYIPPASTVYSSGYRGYGYYSAPGVGIGRPYAYRYGGFGRPFYGPQRFGVGRIGGLGRMF